MKRLIVIVFSILTSTAVYAETYVATGVQPQPIQLLRYATDIWGTIPTSTPKYEACLTIQLDTKYWRFSCSDGIYTKPLGVDGSGTYTRVSGSGPATITITK